MAVIGKIREKSSLLLVVVGGAIVAFVLSDLFSSGSSVFNENLEFIGKIDGKEIRGVKFNERYERELENYRTREKTTDVPEFIQSQLRDQVWQQYLNEYILVSQMEDLGVTVSTEELADMAYGDNPHPQVRQAFTNPNTGQFNKNDVINFLKNMEQDETGNAKRQWLVFENAMKDERRTKKYFNMISKGLGTTSLEAEQYFNSQNTRINISYVVKRYSEVADSTVQVSEGDIKDYYNENQNQFNEKKSRSIQFAEFRVIPSSKDSAFLREWVDETYAAFQLTEDDSNFVNANSDQEFNFRFFSKNDEDLPFDTSLFIQDSAGYTMDPFIDGEVYKMIKISKIKMAPDSVHARHILLAANEKNMDEVKARVDSIKTAIEGGASFEEMAGQFSVDPGSKEEGGDLGFFREGFMIPVINNKCFSAELNEMMVVESPFGVHLLEVTEKSPVVKKMQVAMIVRSIDASRETMDEQFTTANDFSVEMESTEDMMDLRAKYPDVRIENAVVRENDFMISGIESSRGLTRWTYNAELGDVSEVQQYGGSFVVSKLTEVHEDGIAPLERVREEAEIGAIKEKKAQMFIEEMKGITSLAAATEAFGIPAQTAENIVFDGFSVPGLGREPVVQGKIFSMNEGDLSVPLKGENGVYIVQIDSKVSTEAKQDMSFFADQLTQRRTSRVNFEVFEALKDRVDIEDNRFKFY